jgi:hypothetical protein
MDPASVDSLFSILTVGGPVAAVLGFFVVAFVKGWIVPGYVYEREVRAKNDALDAVLQSTEAQKLLIATTAQRRHDARDALR